MFLFVCLFVCLFVFVLFCLKGGGGQFKKNVSALRLLGSTCCCCELKKRMPIPISTDLQSSTHFSLDLASKAITVLPKHINLNYQFCL